MYKGKLTTFLITITFYNQASPPWFLHIRAVPEIILTGVGRRHFFVLWVESVLLTMCPRGGGVNLSWGSRHI